MILGVMGSPRKNGNTNLLLAKALEEFEKAEHRVEMVQLSDYHIDECMGCRYCIENPGKCCIADDMQKLYPKILEASAILVASPVYFNNVTALTKAFMDRTWCLRGKLKDKIGGAIVVGRGYGHELAISAIHAFMLKHHMIIADIGVSVFAFDREEVLKDKRGLSDMKKLVARVLELVNFLKITNKPDIEG